MEEESKEQEEKNFVVYNMPVELSNKYISMAKLHYDNEVWKVLRDAFQALMEKKEGRRNELERRVEQLEMKVSTMQAVDEATNQPDQDGNDIKPTFGTSEGGRDKDDIDKLKQIGDKE